MNARFETRKIVKTQNLGEIFRETRLARGYRIEQIAKKTMIAPEFVEQLEKSNYDKLPAKVYVEGYVRKVAVALGLNTDAMVRIYKKEIGIKENIKSKHVNELEPIKTARNPKVVIHPTLIRNTVIVFLIVAAAGYLWYQVSSLSKPPALAVYEPSADQEISTDEIVVVGHTDPSATLSINGQSVFVSDSGDFKEALTLQEGANNIEVMAKNRLGKITTVSHHIFTKTNRAVAKEPTASVSTTGPVAVRADASTSTQKQPDGVSLTVAITDLATWVQISVDGAQAFSGTMLPGSEKTFSGQQYITLTTGKASKTQVTFNGQKIGALSGTNDVIRDLRFDKGMDLSAFGSKP